ncbi:hypothetical protein HHK36_028114 [Tetracentron sinense]|uniref:CTLH domain-containing protein n=1 Tax=Tetracentron sinense TaxID=13715 RepID=A0A834YKG5_TETSI|nr:hypothetical protein HHK36_028114 [Tetracentron sinense]
MLRLAPLISLETLILFRFTQLPKTLILFRFTQLPKTLGFHTRNCSSSFAAQNFDFLDQFSPFANVGSPCMINSNERRQIVVGLSKMIKQGQGYVLKGFSPGFCPSFLVRIMKFFDNRRTAIAFFKFAFRDDSNSTINLCCVAAHLLAAEELRYLSQDVLSCVIARIGPCRSKEMVGLMWSDHHVYESDFSVLDSLMRAFLNVDMVTHALEILCRMREEGVRPSSSAINILLKSLLRKGDYGSVWKLFRDMVGKGPHPSNFTFNAMVLGFCRKGYLRIGESLLHVMQRFQCEPDVYTYNIVINAYCINGRSSDALAWIHWMIGMGCRPSLVTFGTVINALCKEGNLVEARTLFDGVREVGLSPNTIMYNTLIDGYVKAGEISQANSIYEEMRERGIAPDGVTLNILVAGCCKYGREEDGDRLVRDVSMSGLLPDCSLSDFTIAGLCWASRLDEAMEFLQDMLGKGVPPTVVAFNSIIAGYSKARLEDKAFEAYRVMVEFGLTPSSSTCSSLLLGLSKKGRLKEAGELMDKMIEKGFTLNKVAFTVILDGYFRIGDTMGAQRLWDEMERRGISPDTVAFSAFIDGLSKAGLMDEACKSFVEMSRRGLVPNNFTYNSLIGGFCNCGRLSEALKLEREMRQRGLLPDIFTTNIIINGFCKQGRMKSANDTFMDMHRSGLTPDIVTYNTLISGYCKAFDVVNAEDFVSKMCASGWDPDITTYNIRIHGYCSIRRMSQAVKMLDELVSVGVVPDTVTYNTMMNGVCGDILDRAMILTAKLLKMAFIPNVVTINLLLSHFCSQGLPERALMWGEKLSQISFSFDHVMYKILDRAYRDIQEDAKIPKETSGKSLFLDFLMYITYDYLCRNRPQSYIWLQPLSTTNFSSEDPYGQRLIDAEIHIGSSIAVQKFGLEMTVSKMQNNAAPVELIVEMRVVGISVIDHRPRALSCLYLESLFHVQLVMMVGLPALRVSSYVHELMNFLFFLTWFKIIVGHFQLDNQLPLSLMPVLLAPEHTTETHHPAFKMTITMSNNTTDGTQMILYLAEASWHFGCSEKFKEPSKYAWSEYYEGPSIVPLPEDCYGNKQVYHAATGWLEQESRFFFNMKYFDEKAVGEWDKGKKYLFGFTKVADNRYSMKVFFEIRKQKYLEALDRCRLKLKKEEELKMKKKIPLFGVEENKLKKRILKIHR